MAALWQRLAGMDSLSADFTQTVSAPDGTVSQHNTGTLDVRKPAFMRWQSRVPFEELVVIDGRHVWFYDQDLEQITVRDYDHDIGQLPALVFGSSREQLAEAFAVELLADDGFRLTPRAQDGFVHSLTVYWQDTLPVLLQIDDQLGNTTRLQLHGVTRNGIGDNSRFRFTVPDGVDLIDETRIHPLP